MKINFLYTSQIATALNKSEELIEVPNQFNILQTLHYITQNKVKALRDFIFKNDTEIAPSILIIKNGQQIEPTDHTTLKEGDEIMLFSPISGG